MNTIYILLCIVIVISGQYLSLYEGKKYYYRKRSHVYDVFHRILPEYNTLLANTLKDFFIMIFFVFIIFKDKTLLVPILETFLIVLVIRAIAINITILPKHKKCKDPDNYIEINTIGHCYDKVVSGHFAIGFIVSLYALDKRIINIESCVLFNIINALMILLTRSHYSVDILFAFIIVLYVKQTI